MRFILRGIGIGLVAGMLFFFFPFLLRILLAFLLIGFLIRLLFGWGWHQHSFYSRRSFPPYDNYYRDSPISIDGRNYTPTMRGQGPETQYPVM